MSVCLPIDLEGSAPMDASCLSSGRPCNASADARACWRVGGSGPGDGLRQDAVGLAGWWYVVAFCGDRTPFFLITCISISHMLTDANTHDGQAGRQAGRQCVPFPSPLPSIKPIRPPPLSPSASTEAAPCRLLRRRNMCGVVRLWPRASRDGVAR